MATGRQAMNRAIRIVILLALSAWCACAQAQSYPARPVKIIAPVAPGGLLDFVARMAADYIASKTGQQVIVENRSGAGGTIGMDAVVKAAPDGLTLGLAIANDLVVNPFLYKNLSYDPLHDLVPVAMIADAPQLLVIGSQVPAKTLSEFIEYAKARPGKVNYGSAGAGSLTQIGAMLLAKLVGLDLVHVPYRGIVPAVTDMVGGRIQMLHASLNGVIGHVRSGAVRVLVVTDKERWKDQLPDVPTSAEAGLPDYEMNVWLGLVAPRGTPKPIVDQLNGYMREMTADPAARQRLAGGFVRPLAMTPDEFQSFVTREAARWQRTVHELGVTVSGP